MPDHFERGNDPMEIESRAWMPSMAPCTRAARSLTVIVAGWGLVGCGPSAERAAERGDEALGVVDFPVSCNERAQAEFNRATALLHNMTYPQAREAYEGVARADSECAMAHWGIAMTLFQPSWPTRPGPEELELGWNEVQRAKALEPPTERERVFIAATEAFFREPSSREYWDRMRSWEQAMEAAHVALPDDPEVAAFYALAHLATAAADEIASARAERAAELLAAVYAENPEHPGAMHYLVHANDAPGREHEHLDITRKYETAAPRNPHALHMPTHIYTRLGDWEAVVRGNLRAAEAALEHPAGARGELVSDEFPHALEYLVYAYLQQGKDWDAHDQMERLLAAAPMQITFKTAFHYASTGARYVLERHAWSEAAAIVPREPRTVEWDRFPWPEAVSWFARGMGLTRSGAMDEARRAHERLRELEAAAERTGEDLFTRNVRVLRLELGAWLAHADGDATTSLSLLREAAELEASTPKHAVTPGPTIPAQELLGDLLMEQGRPGEALTAYRAALEAYPGRFNALLGAARAAWAVEDAESARGYYRRLLEVGGAGDRREALEEARRNAAPAPGEEAA